MSRTFQQSKLHLYIECEGSFVLHLKEIERFSGRLFISIESAKRFRTTKEQWSLAMQQYNATQNQKNPIQDEMFTHTLNPVAWDDAISLAKRFCRTIAKKGGTPVQAVKSYGISDLDAPLEKWETAEEIIALAICKPAHRQAC